MARDDLPLSVVLYVESDPWSSDPDSALRVYRISFHR